MRRLKLTIVVACVTIASAGAHQTTGVAAPNMPLACQSYAGNQGAQTICSGEVPSFDGSPLDVDVTKPMQDTGTTHPLIVLLHGFGNNKHEWESTTEEGDGADKWHWNSYWFAEHGYYVLTYTARGFFDDHTPAYAPPTPAGDPATIDPTCGNAGRPGSACLQNDTIRVKSTQVEIRDTQWLASLTAATFPDVNPSQVAVSGGSYGGGESWVQASQPDWTVGSQVANLPVLHLQVAIPKYPWTDLAYSLAPNGHPGLAPFTTGGSGAPDLYASSQDAQASPGDPLSGNPFGVEKQSYVVGLYSLGTTEGVFEEGTSPKPPPCPSTGTQTEPCNSEGPTPFSAWLARVQAGEPYANQDATLEQIRRDFALYHSAYYQTGWSAQAASGHETAVFSISGWTDNLFSPVESFRMFKYLKSLDPLWPVSVAVADVGHSLAQNKPDTWHRLNVQAWQLLQSNINGSHRQQTTVYSEPTLCPGSPNLTSADQLTARSPEDLSHGTLTVNFKSRATLAPDSGIDDPNSLTTDPIVGPVIQRDKCRVAASPKAGSTGYTGYSDPLPNRQTMVGIGYALVSYAAVIPPVPATAVLAERVWDVAPDGTQTLVSRGVYRFDFLDTCAGCDPLSGTVRVPLYGNQWIFLPGHQLRLDLEQADQPTFRPPNAPVDATLNLDSIQLVVPTREASQTVVAGT